MSRSVRACDMKLFSLWPTGHALGASHRVVRVRLAVQPAAGRPGRRPWGRHNLARADPGKTTIRLFEACR